MSNYSGKSPHVAVIGGGVAGATAALHLAEQGVRVTLLEKGPELVNGPPVCHLHAGGNLYREISQQQCIDLLKQSIDTVRLYPHALNRRPTIIATPLSDSQPAGNLVERLEVIKDVYQQLVADDERNAVLGEPKDYFRLYSRDELQRLQQAEQPKEPKSADDWIIPFAKKVKLDELKYPVVLVQEFGLSVFRLAASASLTFDALPNCDVLTDCELIAATLSSDGKWILNYLDGQQKERGLSVEYLINASGYRTGSVDDMTNQKKQRLVEFKSAYITHWEDCSMQWPEVIFHGERGTPNGMAQLTPYADGYFQLHGMTQNITLFENGLVSSDETSSQPQLPVEYENKIRHGWAESAIEERTTRAIWHMSKMIPAFTSAAVAGKPLYGAQQVPGSDPSLRAADVSFAGKNYACIEIVKASSAYLAAAKIYHKLNEVWPEFLPENKKGEKRSIEGVHRRLYNLTAGEVEAKAIELALQRGYPIALAKISGEKS